MGAAVQDLRYALRRMKQAPGFTAAAVATLALGLGLNSSVLSLAYALFLKPLPLDEAARLVAVDQTLAGRPPLGYPFSYPDYTYYRDHARTFADLAAHYSTSPMQIGAANGGFSGMGSVVTANYFNLLRLQPAMGRFFTADEDRVPGRNPVAVLSHDLWRTRFGEDAGILGTTVRVNGTAFSVIGIAPEGFRGVLQGQPPNDLWIPAAMFAVGYRYCDGLARGCNVVNLVGRLADHASIQQAQAEMDGLARQLESTFPRTNTGRGVGVRPARGIRIQEQAQEAPIVALLAAAAALVLLVASANVAGLLLARGLRRRKEIAIRLALGANRGRLIRLLLVESVVLAGAGGLAGLVVAVWSADVLRGFFGISYVGSTLNLDLSLDPRVVLAGMAVAVLAGVGTGIAPAIQATRPDTLPALKDDTAGAGGRRSRMREGLIVAQVAVSVVLLASSGLLVRSFLALQRGPGFDPDAVALVRIRPSLVGYTNERSWAFQRETLRRLATLPGVVAASPAGTPPLPNWIRQTSVQLPGTDSETSALQTGMGYVGARYFDALGVGLVQGRDFDDRDGPDGFRVAIVNETLARRLWPQGGAVGSSLLVGRERCEIVGIAKDVQYLRALQEPLPAVYLSFWQQDRAANWSSDSQTHVRISGSAAVLLPAIRETIAAIDPDVPFSEVRTLGERLEFEFSDVRVARSMLVIFGVLTLVLSCIGLYSALAFAVAQRRREIAIRMALGAARSNVGALVLRRGAVIVGIGMVVGLVAATLAGPLLANLLYGVTPRDPVALLAGPLVLGAVALLAIWLPARRAMGMDPVAALRSE